MLILKRFLFRRMANSMCLSLMSRSRQNSMISSANLFGPISYPRCLWVLATAHLQRNWRRCSTEFVLSTSPMSVRRASWVKLLPQWLTTAQSTCGLERSVSMLTFCADTSRTPPKSASTQYCAAHSLLVFRQTLTMQFSRIRMLPRNSPSMLVCLKMLAPLRIARYRLRTSWTFPL